MNFSFRLAVFLLAIIGFGSAMAGQPTWTGGGATSNWSESANWLDGVVPAANDFLSFPAGPVNLIANNDLAAGTFFGEIIFDGAGYTISGNSIGCNLITDHAISGVNTISAPIVLNKGNGGFIA